MRFGPSDNVPPGPPKYNGPPARGVRGRQGPTAGTEGGATQATVGRLCRLPPARDLSPG
jgi:hypothetical protein